jgi:hypothetical protein
MSEPEYGLVMPFVVCKSQGGPFDDEAFSVGYSLGLLDGELALLTAHSADPAPRWVRSSGMRQVDLIAMRHGYKMKYSEDPADDEWTWVRFNRMEEKS